MKGYQVSILKVFIKTLHLPFMGSHSQMQSKLLHMLTSITYIFARYISAVSIPVANDNYEGKTKGAIFQDLNIKHARAWFKILSIIFILHVINTTCLPVYISKN